ncbi:MAG: hypothetical protein V1767_00845 [Chloroflexota bacterium]
MGKGRIFGTALRSKVTPTGRWVPKTNSHAACVGMVLDGKTGGTRGDVKKRFVKATKGCAANGQDASKVTI